MGDVAEAFLTEAQQLAQLPHHGIVAVHDVGVEQGRGYIVSEYPEGQELSVWMKEAKPTWRQVVSIVADALAAALRKVLDEVVPSGSVTINVPPPEPRTSGGSGSVGAGSVGTGSSGTASAIRRARDAERRQLKVMICNSDASDPEQSIADKLKQLNADLQKRGSPELSVWFAIHTGMAVAGVGDSLEQIAIFASMLSIPPDQRCAPLERSPIRQKERTQALLREWLREYSAAGSRRDLRIRRLEATATGRARRLEATATSRARRLEAGAICAFGGWKPPLGAGLGGWKPPLRAVSRRLEATATSSVSAAGSHRYEQGLGGVAETPGGSGAN